MSFDRDDFRQEHRSGCPINLSLEVFGDKWSLLILREMIFGGKRHFRQMLKSGEGIASNILAYRLRKLAEEGMITRRDDPTHKQKAICSLTEKSIDLVPVFAQLGAWGNRHLPVSEELSVRARVLEEGGPRMWRRFMSELREEHLGMPTDRDAGSAGGPLRVFTLLPDARPVLLNLREPGDFDITPWWALRVLAFDATNAGNWELPVLGQVAAPAAMLIRPDGYIAWVGDGTVSGLRGALTTWFGSP